MSPIAVETGEYHSRSSMYAGYRLHRWYLRRAYEATYALVQRHGRDPLGLPAPRVLLCGTGSAETTRTFVTFVRERAPTATLAVLDLNSIPLEASREQLRSEGITDVHFVQANALQLPFEQGSFDLIETDFFLQFFSEQAKPQLIQEWARVLDAQTGALMTRDYVRAVEGSVNLETVLDKGRQVLFRRTLRSETYATTRGALDALFSQHGLCALFEAPAAGGLRLPLVKLIAARLNA